ncbi:MAG: bifunctional UDP-N-acetylglucosamine diphosphorylase/glucosamine-1-phosphate N-acetyltransferase GlmU [Clostridia bacterium]|jgi:bifunctional UDP-N-acetylglucosamine pyrophosphorylase/glucosamine-1-phosphate N-acetyltransferase
MKELSVIILAAGKGVRMKSNLPKVLHRVCGKEMINHVVDNVKGLSASQIIVVTGYKQDAVKAVLDEKVETVWQEKQLGTGHAVMQAMPLVSKDAKYVLVLYGDTPLVSTETLKGLIDYHRGSSCGMTVLTVEMDNPEGYGRVLRDSAGKITAIVEHKDAGPDQRRIREINSGIYCFDRELLLEGIGSLKNDNAQGEYYLTDIVEFLRDKGIIIGGYRTDDAREVMGVNTKYQLSVVQKIMNRSNLIRLMEDGVIIDDPDSTYIESSVVIGADTRILPGTHIEGSTRIGPDNVIGPGVRIQNCTLGSGNEIEFSVLRDSDIGSGCRIGPYAHIRPGCSIEGGNRIGNFVEVKNSRLEEHSKVSHLSYVGDGDVGRGVNIGCGVVFVNYDGRQKHRTIVEDGAFVGCNVNLVAPVRVKKDAYIAAGSTITRDVEEYSLAIERGQQVEKKDWVKRKGLR